MSKKPAPTADAVAEEIAEAVFTEAISSYSTAPLDPEKEDMQRQIEMLTKQVIKAEDKYSEERRAHARDREVLNSARLELHQNIEYLRSELAKSHDRERKATQCRHGSIPRLVLIALASLITLAIPYFLQALSVIGPQLSYTIQSGLFMAIAWCMALIWERAGR